MTTNTTWRMPGAVLLTGWLLLGGNVLHWQAAAAGNLPSPESTAGAVKTTTPQQQADNLYRAAAALLLQGRKQAAIDSLRQALNLLPAHPDSRQALAILLFEEGEVETAIVLLEQGLLLAPDQTGLRLTLARLLLTRNQPGQAYRTLNEGPGFDMTKSEPHALMAAALQRLDRHEQAVEHYLIVLRQDPVEPRALIALGISLEALHRRQQARQAYSRADDLAELSPEQAAFVRERLREIGR